MEVDCELDSDDECIETVLVEGSPNKAAEVLNSQFALTLFPPNNLPRNGVFTDDNSIGLSSQSVEEEKDEVDDIDEGTWFEDHKEGATMKDDGEFSVPKKSGRKPKLEITKMHHGTFLRRSDHLS
ncbi:OLC1v1018782C1 [Oldenlandia corymbosa var. corymbosa]|uniref:OLC1v1018782C1 n=1 Tax=Oldenlandia corymbosa var. corymbosa TaxID=529605 RepID=A0AAV1ECR6_OLDCO|nr:OLC1v1018782C1 [Oldenlandia corymbosa var. corymbosa]